MNLRMREEKILLTMCRVCGVAYSHLMSSLSLVKSGVMFLRKSGSGRSSRALSECSRISRRWLHSTLASPRQSCQSPPILPEDISKKVSSSPTHTSTRLSDTLPRLSPSDSARFSARSINTPRKMWKDSFSSSSSGGSRRPPLGSRSQLACSAISRARCSMSRLTALESCTMSLSRSSRATLAALAKCPLKDWYVSPTHLARRTCTAILHLRLASRRAPEPSVRLRDRARAWCSFLAGPPPLPSDSSSRQCSSGSMAGLVSSSALRRPPKTVSSSAASTWSPIASSRRWNAATPIEAMFS
mmetsp:Transcript_3774/g.8631  ORF Transcript_3774/g.8631 Transcript_3774/m.8631 type:complete len:300 (+) Transcript_3774:274-1173(+)